MVGVFVFEKTKMLKVHANPTWKGVLDFKATIIYWKSRKSHKREYLEEMPSTSRLV